MSFWQQIWANLVKWFSPPAVPDPPPPVPPSPMPEPPHSDDIDGLLRAHNSERMDEQISLLQLDKRLCHAAQGHADWMATNRNMSHEQTPGTPGFVAANFGARVSKAGYPIAGGGENIAAGQSSVQQVMRSWMNSSGHRANILNDDYWHVGFGVAQDRFGHLYWCSVFAHPRYRGPLVTRVPAALPRALVE